MSNDAHQGPLSIADLLAVWTAAVDRGYQEPLIAAGEGAGLEVFTQLMAQLARASTAVDVTTQALYIRPWSGQTAPPAAGEARAVVTLTFTRTRAVDRPLRLAAGQVFVDEQTTDWGDPGGVVVQTGRRYLLLADLVFLPGESGPATVQAVAENPGWGYNNPLPGTLVLVDQPGTGFYHDRGTLTVTLAPVTTVQPPLQNTAYLATVNEADTFIPEHVGQHMVFTAGANAGKDARVISFARPVPSSNLGSTVGLENLAAFVSATVAGTFVVGELVQIRVGGPTVVGWARLVAAHVGTVNRFGVVVLTGLLAGAVDILGLQSGATATVNVITSNPILVSEAPPVSMPAGSGASWRVLDWAVDWGLVVTNVLSPTGGRLGYLDAIGDERNIPRSPNEADEPYRARVGEVADVVTPNAIRRALTRSLGAIPYCFREVGSALLPGFFYDKPSANGDAYDYDVLTFTGSRASTLLFGDIAATATTFTVISNAALLSALYIQVDSEVMYVLSYGGTTTVTVQRGMFGTLPTFHPAATPVRATFGENEPVNLVNAAGDLKAQGYFGKVVGPDPGSTITIIRRSGVGDFAAGDKLVAPSSHAVYAVASFVPNPYGVLYRWRILLDYVQFRAFFEVGVPRVGFGEFGFAWGDLPGGINHPNNFWDLALGPNAYDGFPAGAPAFYGRAWAAVDKARAGGTSWEMYLTDGAACV